jgi:hypothetical protein
MADEGCKIWSEKAAQENAWIKQNICSPDTGTLSDETYIGTGGKINVYLFGKMLSTQDYDALTKKVRISILGVRESSESYSGNGKKLKIYRMG